MERRVCPYCPAAIEDDDETLCPACRKRIEKQNDLIILLALMDEI